MKKSQLETTKQLEDIRDGKLYRARIILPVRHSSGNFCVARDVLLPFIPYPYLYLEFEHRYYCVNRVKYCVPTNAVSVVLNAVRHTELDAIERLGSEDWVRNSSIWEV